MKKILETKKPKVAIVLGTRPEIIKMAPVIRACQNRALDFYILHTGQHYSKELDEKIFSDLALPKPKYNLHIGSRPYRIQLGLMIKEIRKILYKDRPDVVLVQGDTTSVLAGALAGKKEDIAIAHHEAGIRSDDMSMLEELNRIIVDNISDYFFAPTIEAVKNLKREGKNPENIYLTGNTIVDAVIENSKIAENKSKILKKLSLKKKSYFLATAHRAENVDNEKRLRGIFDGLEKVSENFKLPIIIPLHPRTESKIKEFKIKLSKNLKLIKPIGFLDFLALEKNARLALTDSGGVQEECFILDVPCVTMRDNTERPETIKYGKNILSGAESEKILQSAKTILKSKKKDLNKKNPFGDGRAGEKIVDTLMKELR